MTPTATRIVGGVVAYRDGPRVARAIGSLREQVLPPGAGWSKIWVVVAPDDMGTEEAARGAIAGDDRAEVVVEPHRRGKSAALAEVFRRAEGDVLVLLNGDAQAAPGAVAELLAATEGARSPFAVMARPVVPPGGRGAMYDASGLLWGLHHRLHDELYSRGEGDHLSDELFAVDLRAIPPIRPGIINDGAFIGSWIRQHGGELRYAPSAAVEISLPARFPDHLAQRRRIHVGHRQVHEFVGSSVLSLRELAVRSTGRAFRLIADELQDHPRRWRAFGLLVVAEGLALVLSAWDVARGVSNPAVWPRVDLARIDAGPEVSGRRVPG
jgi:glycosyltransferase involved in cell wall biosynthesis